MKKYLIALLLLTFTHPIWADDGVNTVEHPAEVNSISTPDEVSRVTGLESGSGSGCPAWGTYGTSIGNILFAWNGDHASGNTYACTNDEITINATKSGGTFGSHNGSVTWRHEVANDYIEWAVDSTDIDHDNSDGITICAEMAADDPSAHISIFSFVGDYVDDWVMFRAAPDGWHYSHYSSKSSEYDDTYVPSLHEMEGSYTTLGLTFIVGEAGTDHALYWDSAWTSGDDDDLSAWTDGESEIGFGNTGFGDNDSDFTIRSFAVLRGFKQTCPTW